MVLYGDGPSHSPSTARVVKQQISTDDGATYGAASTAVTSGGANDDAIFGAGLDSLGNLLAWIRHRSSYTTARFPLYRSTDDGATWAELADPAWSPMPEIVGPIIDVPTVGLLCAWQTATPNRQWGIATSADDGATWTQTAVGTALALNAWPVEIRFLYLGSGKILGIGRTESIGDPLFQLQSTDHGATWSVAATNLTDQQQSPAVLLLDGTDIHLYYYARGSGMLRHAVTTEATIWGNPTAWPSRSNLASGSTNVSDAGYAHAVIDALGRHQVVYYDRLGTNLTQIKQLTNTP